ncbi:MAG: cell division protein [Gammaproteobacteria bacterium HGW-Gammaproteobacteria-3]|nr:MAG: cell division protein [Gammaproteobacteria bacterium HGW-Gammaproteobacteria-3]
MDKDILRIVILAVGLIVVVAMVLWSLIKNPRSKRSFNFYDDKNALKNIDPSLALHPENDDFEIVPLGGAVDDFDDEIIVKRHRQPKSSEAETLRNSADGFDEDSTQTTKSMPKLIQFSLVAIEDEGFNGVDLADAFANVGLEYGSLKIYERVDANRLVDFGVASMVEPGTFPETDLEDFNCPGLVFFMQPGAVDEPLEVFDDFIRTIDLLALELGGVKWDNQRQPLTEHTIQAIRNSLH